MSQNNDGDMWSGLLDSGIATFMGKNHRNPQEISADEMDAGIVGFPFDSTCISRTGTNRGPRAIRDASSQTIDYHYEYDTDLGEEYDIVDCGDVPVLPGNAEESIHRGTELLGEVLDTDALPVMLGGDHVVTVAGVNALGQRADSPGLVLVDTHLDTATDVGGERYNHCCPITRAVDEAGFAPENISIIGPSGAMNPREELEYVKQQGINLFPLDEVIQRGPATVARDAVEAANDGTDAVYLTVDVDALDAAYAPGTGVPTAGGMMARELLQIVGVVAAEGIDAMDVVETSPQWDPSDITARMAVRVVVDSLAANAIGEGNGVGTGTRAGRNS